MGLLESRPLLVPPFHVLSQWGPDDIYDSIQTYKQKDFDFCIDTSNISFLLDLDILEASKLVDALSISNGEKLVNALSLYAGLVLLLPSESSRRKNTYNNTEKEEGNPTNTDETFKKKVVTKRLAMLFNLFDVSEKDTLTYDEFTILLLSTFRSIIIMIGKGEEPDETVMESYSFTFYTKLKKRKSDEIKLHEIISLMESIISHEQIDNFHELLVYFQLLPPELPPGYPYFPTGDIVSKKTFSTLPRKIIEENLSPTFYKEFSSLKTTSFDSSIDSMIQGYLHVLCTGNQSSSSIIKRKKLPHGQLLGNFIGNEEEEEESFRNDESFNPIKKKNVWVFQDNSHSLPCWKAETLLQG